MNNAGDIYIFPDTVVHPSAICSDYQQNRLVSHGEVFSSPTTLPTTTLCLLPILQSPISTSSADLPIISTTSTPSLSAPITPASKTQGSTEQRKRESEIEITDSINEQTCHPDPFLKVLKEKNAIFDCTIAMMVQKQEQHDKQLRMMQENHKNQMKMMHEQHNMWLKIQEENLNQMLQIQQSQAELQTSIQHLWQDFSNKGQ